MSSVKIDEVHVMIDFETLGLTSNTVVLSLGAQIFIPTISSHIAGVDFYEEATDVQYSRDVDPETAKWWRTQPPELIPKSTQKLNTLVNKFYTFLTHYIPTAYPEHELILWSNGTDFDIPILYSLYRQHELTPSWLYNNVRDYRTLRKMFPAVAAGKFLGTKHNAGDDAWNEAEHCRSILNHIDNVYEDAGVVRI